jgi:arylsulfatase A-like enzyme
MAAGGWQTVVIRGLATGAGFGVLFGATSLFVGARVTVRATSMVMDPLNPVTLEYAAWTAVFSTVLGLATAALTPRVLDRWPALQLHLLPVAFAVITLTQGGSTRRLPWMAAILLAWGFAAGLRALLLRRPLAAVGATLAIAAGWLAVLLRMAPAAPIAAESAAQAHPGAPNVLWVIFDTVRADHLPTGGYERDTAPNLAKLAEQGAVFERAYSTGSWTVPAHASMFTGTWLSRHRCHDGRTYLDDRLPTASEAMATAGYDTGLFTSNPWLDRSTGLARGFQRVESAWQVSNYFDWFPALLPFARWFVPDKGAIAATDGFVRWLDERDERPFFAVVNYLEAHVPYQEIRPEDLAAFLPDRADRERAVQASDAYQQFLWQAPAPPGPLEDVPDLVALYDGGIRSDDRELGRLLDALRAAGKLDDTLVIVTADHGEAFGESAHWEHGINATEEVVHVPMILVWPGRVPAGARVADPVSLADLLPTALEAAGRSGDVPASVEGRSLLPVLSGGGDPDRAVFYEQFPVASHLTVRRLTAFGGVPETHRVTGIQVGDLRLVRGPAEAERLHDMAAAGEREDLAAARPDDVQRLRARLDTFLAGQVEIGADAPVAGHDEAMKEHLQQLGYVE